MRRVAAGLLAGALVFLSICFLVVAIQLSVDFLSARLPFGSNFYRALIVSACLGGMIGTVSWMRRSR